jgi:hypothetical protein
VTLARSLRAKRAAHFLLLPELAHSPPNEAIVSALLDLGYAVDLFAPNTGAAPASSYGPRVRELPVQYGRRWLTKNAASPAWRRYDVFSGTSEDPLAVVGLLAWLHRKPSFLLVDEIKSGAYYGDSPETWKKICRWGMRRADFNIVNDSARVELLREYAGIGSGARVLVYPGCYRKPPAAADTKATRQRWGMSSSAFIVGASGGFNLTTGGGWLIEALQRNESMHAVIQPLGVDPLARFLLDRVEGHQRLYVENRRLDWSEAWACAAAVDVGLAVYTNTAPQFQNMGISSNRLCMYLAMGVPVIASRQPSFRFLEEYDCGVLVGSAGEMLEALDHMRSRLAQMKANALRCAREYIDAAGRYQQLRDLIAGLTR